jgi:uncharacterized protein (DUF1800 family)
MAITECELTSGLNPYIPSPENPWNEMKAKHIMRRLGYGASKQKISEILLQNPGDLIDQLIQDALNTPRPPAPTWANRTFSQYSDFQNEIQSQILEWALVWLGEMTTNPLRAKLNLFWSNHFVTRLEAYACPSWMYQYWKVLDDHSFGNFKSFTKAIGITPAMLVFLNGVQNTRLEPNENYARELLELFTLGRDQGYTQTDITNTARALTGYNLFTELCAPINYLPILHDPGIKTIFGKSAAYNYDSLHNLLFEERDELIAKFICRKLYRAFVSPESDEAIVQQLATIFLQNNFNLLPVYQVLFKSERFFDELVVGTIIKSPIEYLMMFVHESEIPLNTELRTLLLLQAGDNGQFLFNPPDVAGWPGDKDWVNTSKLTQRWLAMDYFIYYTFLNNQQALAQLPQKQSSSLDNPAIISQDIIDFFLSKGLQTPLEYDQAMRIFKWEVPENYYANGEWNIFWPTISPQVAFLLQHMVRIPEFQLT